MFYYFTMVVNATWGHAFLDSWLDLNFRPLFPIGWRRSVESPPLPLSISCAPVENACLLFLLRLEDTDELKQRHRRSFGKHRQSSQDSNKQSFLTRLERHPVKLNGKRVEGWTPGGADPKPHHLVAKSGKAVTPLAGAICGEYGNDMNTMLFCPRGPSETFPLLL